MFHSTSEQWSSSPDSGWNDVSEEQPALGSADKKKSSWELYILGPVHLSWREQGESHDVTYALAPRHLELLVLLALSPSGSTRDHVREVLWPNAGGPRPNNAYHATLSQLRKALKRAVGSGPHT